MENNTLPFVLYKLVILIRRDGVEEYQKHYPPWGQVVPRIFIISL